MGKEHPGVNPKKEGSNSLPLAKGHTGKLERATGEYKQLITVDDVISYLDKDIDHACILIQTVIDEIKQIMVKQYYINNWSSFRHNHKNPFVDQYIRIV